MLLLLLLSLLLLMCGGCYEVFCWVPVASYYKVRNILEELHKKLQKESEYRIKKIKKKSVFLLNNV